MDPVSGEDNFLRCGECDGSRPAGPGLRDHQRGNRCPYLPPTEWTDAGRLPCGEDGLDHGAAAPYCPGALARQPVAMTTLRARGWWEKGQLALLYPEGVPQVVVEAVEAADADLQRWRAEGQRLLKPEPSGKE